MPIPMVEDAEKIVEYMLEEYKALRKEIEARSDTTGKYGWPVIAVVFGGLVGAKDVLARAQDIPLLVVPMVAMTIAGLTANARYEIDETRLALARLEARMSRLVGGPAPLCHESEHVRLWRAPSPLVPMFRHDYQFKVVRAILALLVYLAIEYALWSSLKPGSRQLLIENRARSVLTIGLITIPAMIQLVNEYRALVLRRRDYSSEIA